MSNDDITHNLANSGGDDKSTQPSITAVFRLLQDIDQRFNGRFDTLDNRLGIVESRLDEIESRIESRFDKIESRLEMVESRLDKIESRLDKIESRLEMVESRLDKIEGRFDSLEAQLARDFASIDARFVALSDHMKAEFLRLSDKLCDKIDRARLHSEADYEDMLRRMRQLESKAS